jgi:hypothetical protein
MVSVRKELSNYWAFLVIFLLLKMKEENLMEVFLVEVTADYEDKTIGVASSREKAEEMLETYRESGSYYQLQCEGIREITLDAVYG